MKLYLAPMEGVVDHHLRKIYSQIGGIDYCVTEFIRINDAVLPRRVFMKYCPELLTQQQNDTQYCIPTRVQLLGSHPKLLALNAKKAAKLGAIGIDLNFGCPAKTVNKNRGGACLLDETDLIYEIVDAVRQAVPAHVPVTAKIRLGYNDRDSYLQNAQAIALAGASELFVHARSKRDGYNPPAYWPLISEIKRTVSIPVIANGEIWTLRDYIQCKTESDCLDFMLGRGLLANPGLALEIRAYENGRVPPKLDWKDTLKLLHQFFIETSQAYPKKHTGNRVKQWLHYLKNNYSEAHNLFEEIKRERNFDSINAVFKRELNTA
jgi:tRNA-dihydrouridine synthase C